MRDIQLANLSEIRQLEKYTNASVQIGNHCMEDHAPTSEFLYYRVILEQNDIDRIFVLYEPGLANLTLDQTCRLKDIISTACKDKRVEQAISGGSSFPKGINLKSDPNMELELVASELYTAPLIIIDGNHRAIAHYTTYGNLHGVPAYVCIHKNISQWKYIPPLAKNLYINS